MPIGRAWFLLTRTRQIYHRRALSLRFLASEFLGSDFLAVQYFLLNHVLCLYMLLFLMCFLGKHLATRCLIYVDM